ncbi:group II truncated hemoglobin [Amycolatopsis sp. FBCC-B4732]|uniref:group II truncated hemoglobin n=1 Tax=Amycolatopsis sp. FBCC-B4732 TaxID=3079339 RepID=UPI001FF5C003|nr:group II truncated hemoglobin [Amycolatopsis sp. FBCC-B4732]UOX84905.1 group II truncated hemoglobin [Amycolatopsis sp. FBCC-B4732]
MIVEYLRYTVPEAARADFEKAAAGHHVERAPGRYLVRAPSPFGGIEGFTPEGEPERYETTTPSLYDWAGGREALVRLLTIFYGHVLEDPLLEPVFRTMDPHHAEHVADWLGEVFGGPPAYTGSHGGHAHMIGRHLGRAITEPQRRRWVSLLLDAADEAQLPDDPEFRAAFAGYVEWGSRLAVVFSAPGARPNPHEPVPHWDWPRPPWPTDGA